MNSGTCENFVAIPRMLSCNSFLNYESIVLKGELKMSDKVKFYIAVSNNLVWAALKPVNIVSILIKFLTSSRWALDLISDSYSGNSVLIIAISSSYIPE